jgi:hypothetical protein
MIMPDIPSKLFTAFNEVTYYDEPHKYFVNGKELISVTTLLGRYEKEFNEDYWAGVKSLEYKISPKEVKEGWRFINEVGTTRGSFSHDYAENLFNNKIFPQNTEDIVKNFGFNPISESSLKVKTHIDNFYKYSFNKLIPIKTEYVVYDKEYGIAGMVDLLFWNVKAQEFQIWDWKTNKDFEGWSKTKGYETEVGIENYNGCLSFLKKNDINHYSLQLGTYKHIIEKNTGIKLGKSYLVWISHLEDRFHVIETLDRSIYINKMIQSYVNRVN